MITAGVLFAYQHTAQRGGDEATTRAMVFTTLVFSNILLSLVNRSFTYSVFETIRYKNKLFAIIVVATLVLLFAILHIPAVADFFQVTALSAGQLTMAMVIAGISVLWFEIYKISKRKLYSQ